MATAFPSPLEQLEHDFRSNNAHLSEQHRQQLYLPTISPLPSHRSHRMADQIPRSMACPTSDMAQFPTSSFGFMGRVQSAPAPIMERPLSAMNTLDALGRSTSTMATWQPTCDEQQNAYAIYSQSTPIQNQSMQQSFANPSPYGMVEYSPADYVSNFIEPSSSPSLPLSLPQHPQNMHVQLTPSTQWSPSLDRSPSPSTPSTTLMTPVTHMNSMSRQSSYNPLFFDDISQSDPSLFPILPEDGAISFSANPKNINHCVDIPNFLNHFTGSSSEAFLTSLPVSTSSVPALVSSQNELDLAEDMTRSASSSSESCASFASTPSTGSRHVRRARETNAQAGRCRIAPKALTSNAKIESASSHAQMVRIQSEDGSSKDVGVITKAAYIRPQHPKIMCTHCNERPDGFRGTHELDRHIQRAHTAVRKGFVCVDASPDKKFLANCKHCRNRKVYGAYYNAAAHLRRAHFHPRKRGRKGKHDEKRGGIGGGDDPPMDYLKQHWIRDIEVENKITIAQSPATASDSPEPSDMNSYDSSSYELDLSYPTNQPTTNTSMPSNTVPNQYIDYTMYPDTSYNANMYTNPLPTMSSNINDFQFDAYRT